MRKHYLDNIRWFTIFLVFIFHVFFYFNNIGIKPIFSGLPEYIPGNAFRLDSLFQYAVYPWFMVLLFVVAGMSACYSLKNKTNKDFLKSRAQKLLVPSLLGVLCFGWISGSIVINQCAGNEMKDVPIFIRFFIYTFSGTGAMWFCQVLFISSALLLLIRKIDIAINKDERFFVKGNIQTAVLLPLFFALLWGASKILNTPVVTAYRFGIYISAFLAGYYYFSQESAIVLVKKLRFVSTALALLSGAYFIYRAYGTYYADIKLLGAWYSNLFVFFAVLSILGLFSAYFDKTTSFSKFCVNECFAFYVLHIPVLLVLLIILTLTSLPIWIKYLILIPCGLCLTLLLGLLIKKIPVLRYIVLGIKTNPQSKIPSNS